MVNGEFSASQLTQIEKAIQRAEQVTSLTFAVYVGPLEEGRESAQGMFDSLPNAEKSVLVAVDPEARSVDILTGTDAERWLPNARCRLAILTMSSRFTVGDIPGGIRDGIYLLAEQAIHPKVLLTDEPA